MKNVLWVTFNQNLMMRRGSLRHYFDPSILNTILYIQFRVDQQIICIRGIILLLKHKNYKPLI